MNKSCPPLLARAVPSSLLQFPGRSLGWRTPAISGCRGRRACQRRDIFGTASGVRRCGGGTRRGSRAARARACVRGGPVDTPGGGGGGGGEGGGAAGGGRDPRGPGGGRPRGGGAGRRRG